MEENTDPEANTAELPGEPIEAPEVEELGDKEVTAEESPGDVNLATDDSQVETDAADKTDEDENKEGAKEHGSLKEEETDELKEPTETEQVDAEEKLEEEEYKGDLEITEELKETDESQDAQDESQDAKDDAQDAKDESQDVKDESQDVKEHTDETLPKESEEPPTEVPAETKPQEKKHSLERKESINYDVAPRFESEIEVRQPSGDFLVMGAEAASKVKFYKYMGLDEEEEEEEEIELEVEEEQPRIDRTPYYEKHIILTSAIEHERLENNVLQKKLAIYFQRRRMEHVLKETDQKIDTQQKYNKKLDAYAELMEINTRQWNTVSEELQNLKEERERKCNQLQKQFEKMQAREQEIGIGLINTNTGNVIPDKVVERLIRLQKSGMEQVSGMRLKFIKLKYRVAEKQEAITIINKIGEDLFLMDFDQLKVENRSLADKIEERDEELTKLRGRCQNTIQILAHMREKTAALESDIEDLREDLAVIETESLQVREELNTLKQERDYYRNMANKLRNESGLLTEVELLRDMEESMAELQMLTEDLNIMKAENKIKAQQTRNIRKHIEYTTEGMAKRSYKNFPEKSLAHPTLYKGRPSIFAPTLPKDAFRHLRYFKPKPTIGKNKRKLNTMQHTTFTNTLQ